MAHAVAEGGLGPALGRPRLGFEEPRIEDRAARGEHLEKRSIACFPGLLQKGEVLL